MLHNYTINLIMNVTVKLPDELCKQARHRAVDENKSLSAWLADLVRCSLEHDEGKYNKEFTKSLCDAFSTHHAESVYEKELPLEDRKAGSVRTFDFSEE